MICPLSGRQVKYQYRISAFFKKNADFGQKNTGFGRKMQTLGRKIRVSAKICLQAFFFCVSIDFAWFRVNKIHAV